MSASPRPVADATAPDVPVTYRWDAVTGILSVRLAHPDRGPEGQFAMAGRDGSWVTLEVSGDRLVGVDIVVWPETRELPGLVAPVTEPRRLSWRRLAAAPGVRALTAPLVAESCAARGIVRIRVGGRRVVRTVREAPDVCIDLDAGGSFAGIWFLNVPPCPEGS